MKVQISAKRNLFIYYFGIKAFSFRSEYAHITIDKAFSNFGICQRICFYHALETPLIDPTANLRLHILFASNTFVDLSNYFKLL